MTKPTKNASLMTTQEVMAYLHVVRTTVTMLVETGQLRVFKVGEGSKRKHWRFRPEDVDAVLVQIDPGEVT